MCDNRLPTRLLWEALLEKRWKLPRVWGWKAMSHPWFPEYIPDLYHVSEGQQWKEPFIASRSSTNLRGSSGSQELTGNPSTCKGQTNGGPGPHTPQSCTSSCAVLTDSCSFLRFQRLAQGVQLLLCLQKSPQTSTKGCLHLKDQGQELLFENSDYCLALVVIHTTTKKA